jgi:periplasmic protein CpxP/Spy
MNRCFAVLAAGAVALSFTLTGPAPAMAQNDQGKAAQGEQRQGQRQGAQRGGQRGQRGGQRAPGGRLQAALAKLNLNADQKTKIKAVTDDSEAQLKKIRDGQGTPEEKREKSRPIMQNTREKVMAILTPEQRKQLEAELGSARRGAEGRRGGQGRPGGQRRRGGNRGA